jgi:hypothetical protein
VESLLIVQLFVGHYISTAPTQVDLASIRQNIAATRHLLHLLQPQLEDKARRKLRRLAQRLLNIDHELDHLTPK